MVIRAITSIIFVSVVLGQHQSNFYPDRSVIVHLFEWKWKDIADECERFLGPEGFGGVQVSPVTENTIVENRPWWERYQPISYLLRTRSGDENDFKDMVNRCNTVGVRIYVDVLLNHMSAPHNKMIGTGGSTADPANKNFPEVPYTKDDFHKSCTINNYNNPIEVRNCELQGLVDLDQSKPHVRERLITFLNSLIDMGVAGFRIDAAKHMWPQDLQVIYNSIKNLNTTFKFPANARPLIYQEVIDLGGEGIKKTDYNSMGLVTEFRYSAEIGKMFRGGNQLKWLKNWGPEWSFLPSRDALIFVDNHDNQRSHGAGGADILTYKNTDEYKLANIFMLAHPYGFPRVMSSFNFTSTDQGPPEDKNENIISPAINSDGSCTGGWICEHRWKEISKMVSFRSVTNGADISNWWDNGNNQIAFSRGNKGFVVINNENSEMSSTLQTGLPSGTYCDVLSGKLKNGKCTGRSFVVLNDSKVEIKQLKPKSAVVLHIKERIP